MRAATPGLSMLDMGATAQLPCTRLPIRKILDAAEADVALQSGKQSRNLRAIPLTIRAGAEGKAPGVAVRLIAARGIAGQQCHEH